MSALIPWEKLMRSKRPHTLNQGNGAVDGGERDAEERKLYLVREALP